MKSFLLLALSALTAGPLMAQVVVNEVCASNLDDFADNNGDYEDWFELYNPTGAPVDLSGWYVSNRAGNPLKWAIPAGTTAPANGYLIFYCSKRNTAAGGYLHTNFKLSQCDDDHVLLSDPGGTLVDDFAFALNNRTKLGHSRGRVTDGDPNWSLFTNPTPGASNVGAIAGYTDRPVLTPAAGFYGSAQSITITGPAGATIRYTVDGSEPTAASPIYSGPIPIATTAVVRTACFGAAGSQPSFTETNTYFINVSHTVAVVSLAGSGLNDLFDGDEDDPFGSIEYFGPDQQLRDEATGQFNKHGNDSWFYDQRGVDYITRDQAGYNDALHYPIFRTQEREKYQRLILKAAANDNYPFEGTPGTNFAGELGGAHIRDAYVQSLAQTGGLRLDVRSYEPCVLYLNGLYWGLYELREKTDDADYTREYFDQDEYDLQYLKTWGTTWSEYGGAQAQNDWDALCSYIATTDMSDPAAFAYVDGQYNWKSLVDYMVLGSYVVCSDWLNWNTMWWRGLSPDGEHKKWGYGLWDVDATFQHYINYSEVPNQTPEADPCTPEQLGNLGGQGHVPNLNKLIAENPTVHDYYVNRYIDLGNSTFNCGHMLPFLDSLVALITPEMPAQIARWGGTLGQWQANVQDLRDFIGTRCTSIQQGLVDCYELDGPYTVVFKVEPPLSGEIKINSISPGVFPFTGTYFGGINTTLEAESAEGWVFDHWEALHHTLAPSMIDSIGTLTFTSTDTVVAHFRPPVKYPIVLMTDPPNTGSISFNTDLYSVLPATVEVLPGAVDTLTVHPNMYYDFLYWEFKYNLPNSNDTTTEAIAATFFQPDTVIAHLRAQDYVYFGPNAFTPNGDDINDVWVPWNNVIDLDTYSIRVFDRWGKEVFASTDPYKTWDGLVNGKPVPVGVYAFKTHAVEAISREEHDILGHVTVVR